MEKKKETKSKRKKTKKKPSKKTHALLVKGHSPQVRREAEFGASMKLPRC
jgi:hypothetical protein